MNKVTEEFLEGATAWMPPKFANFLKPKWGVPFLTVMEDAVEWIPGLKGEDFIDLHKAIAVFWNRPEGLGIITLEIANKEKENLLLALKKAIAKRKKNEK